LISLRFLSAHQAACALWLPSVDFNSKRADNRKPICPLCLSKQSRGSGQMVSKWCNPAVGRLGMQPATTARIDCASTIVTYRSREIAEPTPSSLVTSHTPTLRSQSRKTPHLAWILRLEDRFFKSIIPHSGTNTSRISSFMCLQVSWDSKLRAFLLHVAILAILRRMLLLVVCLAERPA
jgi:hypothetical protein